MLRHDAHDLLAARDDLADIGDDRGCTRPAIGARNVKWSIAASALARRCSTSSTRRSASLSFSASSETKDLDGLFAVASDDVEPSGEGSEISSCFASWVI